VHPSSPLKTHGTPLTPLTGTGKKLQPGARILAFDFGGTKIAAGIINDSGQILDQIHTMAHFAQGRQAVMQQIIEIGNALLQKDPEISAVGFASAGPLNPVTGTLHRPTNFQSWGDFKIVEALEKQWSIPVFLDNDAAAAALAEYWQADIPVRENLMVLTLGTGLGTALILNGRLVRAGNYAHTEAGHMIIQAQDPLASCGCGCYGCAEAYLSGTNFAKRFNAQHEKNFSAEQITQLARSGNAAALKAFQDYGKWFAITVANFTRIFNPEVFIISGGFAASADLFLSHAHDCLAEYLPSHIVYGAMPQVLCSKLGTSTGIVGAGYIGLTNLSLLRPIPGFQELPFANANF
jgi:glucokinase